MSGGFFNYQDQMLKEEIFGYHHSRKDPFEDREISELIYDVFKLIHHYDYYKSGDYGEEDYKEIKKDFKKKWLETPREEQVKRLIISGMQELKGELYETFGIKKEGEEKSV